MRSPQEKFLNANTMFLMGKHQEAFKEYRELARSYRDPVAASNVGYMYHRGIAVVRDYKIALEFYTAAREGDGGVSYFNMALMYLRGQGVDMDFKKAIEYMHQAANLGCPDARLYLGLAYILGYAYDPVEIECISLIPFYRVIYRDISTPLLEGQGYDETIEDRRYEAIECDADNAFEMYRALSNEHLDDPCAEKQSAAANFMMAKFYIEGVGDHYNPSLGYRMMERAAIFDRSREAAEFLLANSKIARTHKVNIPRLETLAAYSYFRPVMGNLGTPRSHRVPLLLPKAE